MRCAFQNDRPDSLVLQFVSNFQSDQSPAHDDGTFYSLLQELTKLFRILRGTQHKSSRKLISFNRRPNRRSSNCQNQLIIRKCHGFSLFHLTGIDKLFLTVNSDCFRLAVQIYFCHFPVLVGRIGIQLINISHFSAHIIGQTASGIGYIRMLFQQRDLTFVSQFPF